LFDSVLKVFGESSERTGQEKKPWLEEGRFHTLLPYESVENAS